MNPSLSAFFLILFAVPLVAQTPQPRFSYEDRSGTMGHTLTVEGKTFGPYKEILSLTPSTSATTGLFLVNRRDKTYIVAQGKESGPLSADNEVDQAFISDDGKLAFVSATKYSNDEDGTAETLLWVNGKSYGPFASLQVVEYAESGGSWIATVGLDEEQSGILFNGKLLGPFSSVDHTWMSPDGKNWGYVTTDKEGQTTVVTPERSYEGVQDFNFNLMYPREPHWGFAIRIGDEEELIVVDGKTYQGYLNFSGLTTTFSGRHWAFEALKLTEAGDYPVVVIDGKEFVGEGLGSAYLGDKESFHWTVKDGSKVTLQVLSLP